MPGLGGAGPRSLPASVSRGFREGGALQASGDGVLRRGGGRAVEGLRKPAAAGIRRRAAL